jgi:hypothetical protein
MYDAKLTNHFTTAMLETGISYYLLLSCQGREAFKILFGSILLFLLLKYLFAGRQKKQNVS